MLRVLFVTRPPVDLTAGRTDFSKTSIRPNLILLFLINYLRTPLENNWKSFDVNLSSRSGDHQRKHSSHVIDVDRSLHSSYTFANISKADLRWCHFPLLSLSLFSRFARATAFGIHIDRQHIYFGIDYRGEDEKIRTGGRRFEKIALVLFKPECSWRKNRIE